MKGARAGTDVRVMARASGGRHRALRARLSDQKGVEIDVPAVTQSSTSTAWGMVRRSGCIMICATAWLRASSY